MNATFEWDGDSAEEAAERFRALEPALLDELETAADDIGVRIRGAAQENAPVDRNELRSNLEYAIVNIGADLVQITVGTNVDQAEPQEKGTDPFFPPPSELRGWAGRVLGDEDLAFVVARSISESGIEASEYLLQAFEDNLEWAMDRIAQAVQNSFEEVGLA